MIMTTVHQHLWSFSDISLLALYRLSIVLHKGGMRGLILTTHFSVQLVRRSSRLHFVRFLSLSLCASGRTNNNNFNNTLCLDKRHLGVCFCEELAKLDDIRLSYYENKKDDVFLWDSVVI